MIAHGWARLGQRGAARRERSIRCPACRSELGFALNNATCLVFEERVVVQMLDTGQVRLSAECPGCKELRLVAALAKLPRAGAEPQHVPATLAGLGTAALG